MTLTKLPPSGILGPYLKEFMEKILFVKDLRPKEEIETLFAIKTISLVESRDGRPYIKIVLSDSSGDIEGRIWSNPKEYAKHLSSGHFVWAKGKLNLYQGRKQFIVLDIAKVDRTQVHEDDFVHKAALPPEEMYRRLLALVDKVNDHYIKNLLMDILQDESIAKRLKLWPAGRSIHHAYRSGLLEHILSCSELARQLCPRYGCNFNYVLAGCILHDLCKIDELGEGIHPEYTDEGKLVGHLTAGIQLIERFSKKEDPLPRSMKLHLKHILLSHHGEYEFGSPKIPQTSEAMLVHLIDLMDSKMNAFETIKRTDSQGGDWSSYIQHLDRMVYKRALPTFRSPKDSHTNSSMRPRPGAHGPLKQNLEALLKDFVVSSPSSSPSLDRDKI
ncbi:MAG: HD domain-containing protein [Bacteriovoracales bacterium]|nr:HD domain-containing protein [Bacteriovoracales bacterium]